ncbi:MAG: SH3 domain-containing protein, partial [Burkholderiales bacterium]|nr:SH3 domain-containing protein [Anaerolineae bacterium]
TDMESAAIDADDAWARAVASIGDAEPSAADDWITSLGGQGYETAAEPLPDDFLSSLGIEPQDQPPAAEPLPDDFLSGLGIEASQDEPAYDEAAINDEWQMLQGLVQQDMASIGVQDELGYEPQEFDFNDEWPIIEGFVQDEDAAEPLPADFLSDLGLSEPVIEEARPGTGSLEDFGSLFDESFAAEAEQQANELDFLNELNFESDSPDAEEAWPVSDGPLEEYVVEFPDEPAAEYAAPAEEMDFDFDSMLGGQQAEEVPAEGMEFDFDAMMSEVGGVASQTQDVDLAEPSLDDLFGDFTQEQEPAIARADDDLFSFLVDEQAADASAADPMKQAEMEAFLDSLGLAQEESRPRPVVDMTEGIALSGAQPADEDLLREFGFLTDDESQAAVPAAESDIFETAFDPDFLTNLQEAERQMGVERTPEPAQESPMDWFAEMENDFASADMSASELRGVPQGDANLLNWLEELGDVTEADAAVPIPVPESIAPRRPLPRSEVEAQASEELSFDDLDTFLASLDDSQLALPDTGSLISTGEADIDTLLSDPAFIDMDLDRTQINETPGIERASDLFLSELGAAVGNSSASAILRQQDDRPLDELPERLRKLHQRSEQLPTPASAAESGALNQLLPGLTDSLPASTMKAGLPGLTSALALSGEQQGKVNLLKQLVAFEAQALSQAAAAAPSTPALRGPSAIDLTYEGPYSSLDEDEEGAREESRAEKVVQETAPVARRRQRQVGRLVISLLLLLAVVAPFYFSQLRVGDLPPSRFAAGSDAQQAFSRIDSLQPREYVLVGIEYNPTAAGELDGMTDAILRHILLRRARPVLVSRSPIGLLHAGNILNTISNDPAFLAELGQPEGLTANRDYFVLRYLAGDVVGLRSFARGTSAIGLNDAFGNPSGITLNDLRDFALTVVVAERPEDVRAWVEQVSPVMPAPLVMATSYSTAPLAEPYVRAASDSGVGIEGLLVGYRDAYTYAELIETLTASRRPTEPEPETLVPEPSEEGDESPGGETPSDSEAGVDTAAGETESEANVGEEPTVEDQLPVIGTATVSAAQQINVRSGPGTTFAAVAVLQPGSQVDVIARSNDWTQVRLEDGDEGWVSTPLLTIQDLPEATPESPDAVAASKRISSAVARRAYQDPTDEPDADETEEAVVTEETEESDVEATVEAESTEAVVDAAPSAPSGGAAIPGLTMPSSPGYRDERWYAMTLGIIVTVFIITISSVVNVLRGLRRRRVS